MSPARFRWGVLFILCGTILLLNNMGHLSWWAWSEIAALWPLILIAIGIEKIFAGSKLKIISYLSTVALAAFVIWAAFSGVDGKGWGGSNRFTLETDSSITKLFGKLEMDDNDLNIKMSRRNLFQSRYRGSGLPPKIDHHDDGNTMWVDVSESNTPRWLHIGSRRSNELDVYLSNDIPISLVCRGDKSDMRIDCRKLKLEEITVDSERGNIRLFVGDLLDNVKVSLEGDDADFRLFLPPDCGLRVSGMEEAVSRLLTRIGLVESGKYYESQGFDSLTPRVELELSRDLSQLSIDYY